MEGRETKLELGDWSIVIVFGYGNIELSVVSVLLLLEAILADSMCNG